MSSVDDTLAEREGMYGKYYNVASTAQRLKETIRGGYSYRRLTDIQRESLDMLCNKVARIVNGDPNIADHWHDIGGYAKLAEVEIEECDDSSTN